MSKVVESNSSSGLVCALLTSMAQMHVLLIIIGCDMIIVVIIAVPF